MEISEARVDQERSHLEQHETSFEETIKILQEGKQQFDEDLKQLIEKGKKQESPSVIAMKMKEDFDTFWQNLDISQDKSASVGHEPVNTPSRVLKVLGLQSDDSIEYKTLTKQEVQGLVCTTTVHNGAKEDNYEFESRRHGKLKLIKTQEELHQIFAEIKNSK